MTASVFVARILGKEAFGELSIVRSTVDMFGVLAGFGLGVTATKHVAELRRSFPERAGRILVLSCFVAVTAGTVMSLSLFAIAPWLAACCLGSSRLSVLLRAACPMLLLSALNGAQTGALTGFEAFRTIALVNLVVGVLSFPIMLGAIWCFGLYGAIGGQTATLFIAWFLNHLAVRRCAAHCDVPLRFAGCLGELTVLRDFSIPAMFSSMLVAPVNWLCGAMLVNQPHGYAQMGLFSVANQFYSAMLFLPGVLGGVVLPLLSEQLGQRSFSRSRRLLTASVCVNASVVFPLAVLGCAASPGIMALYGEQFSEGAATLAVVLGTAALAAIQSPVGQVITASGKMWIALLMNLGWALVFLLATQLLLDWGAFGLATARLSAYLIHTTWVLAYAIQITRHRDEPTVISPIIARPEARVPVC